MEPVHRERLEWKLLAEMNHTNNVPEYERLPLNGIVVVDFGQNVAGPLTASLLADFGADVIHIDPPTGPFMADSPANVRLNENKKVVRIDLKSESVRIFSRRKKSKALLKTFQTDRVWNVFEK